MSSFFQKASDKKARFKAEYMEKVNNLPMLLNRLPQKPILFTFYYEDAPDPDSVARNFPYQVAFKVNANPSEIIGEIDRHCHAAEDKAAFRYSLSNTLNGIKNPNSVDKIDCYIYFSTHGECCWIAPYY